MGKNSQLVIRCYTRPRAPRAPRPCYVSKTGSALIEQKIYFFLKFRFPTPAYPERLINWPD